MTTRHRSRCLLTTTVAVLMAASAALGTTVPAQAATNAYEPGPAPSEESIAADRGSFAVSEAGVPRDAVAGFGGGTVYYPTDTSAGTFGAVAIAPGFTATESSLAWLGPRLASQGFVVFTIDTITTDDQPAERGDELRAALSYLTTSSPVRDRIDPSRLAVMGHSMGGGGALQAAKDDPSIRAVIAMTPYDLDSTWPEVTTPTLIIGAEDDMIAPVHYHAKPFYESLTSAPAREYVELRHQSHFAPNYPDTTIASASIAWLKRYLDGDQRYQRLACPAHAVSWLISDFRSGC
ncbi:alpha/beta hydrolase [Clavibacter michiganensis]|uniref:alpha/beta hydrolase family protein n=1 Tax=Clavibacter michiganensis TaxID=28447 RepID=UPI000CE855FA|nr:alpha/beta fold hydrolase [Clavibacter michiganensis]PPF91286.1 alpha/beta hydrolase [Clavibacter michiganensis]PPF99328.1 alpha/beta hydrolase [Clavibacter michiganensis]